MTQVMIVLIGAGLLMLSAFSGDTVKAKTPEPVPEKPAAEDTAGADEGESEPTREEVLLAMVEPEAYRSAENLNVQPGAYISVLMREGSSDFSGSFKKGADQACADLNEELGYTGSDKVRLSCNVPSEDTVTAQINILDEELALYPDVAAVSITDAASCAVQFDLAMENGIYIIGFDAYPSYDQVAATVQTDNSAAGAKAAERLAAAVIKREEEAAAKAAEEQAEDAAPQEETAAEEESPEKVLIVSHDKTSANLTARTGGFSARLAELDAGLLCAPVCYLSDFETIRADIETFYNGDDNPDNDVQEAPLDTRRVLDYYFERYTGLKAVFAADEASAVEVLKYIADRKADAGISVAGFGSTETLQPYLNSGMLDAYVEENGYGMGYATAIAAFRVAAGKGNVEKITVGYTLWPQEESPD